MNERIDGQMTPQSMTFIWSVTDDGWPDEQMDTQHSQQSSGWHNLNMISKRNMFVREYIKASNIFCAACLIYAQYCMVLGLKPICKEFLPPNWSPFWKKEKSTLI